MMSKETYLTAQEAVTLGFIDELVNDQYMKAVAIGKPFQPKQKTTEDNILEQIRALLSEESVKT
jgi:hypothetical protein